MKLSQPRDGQPLKIRKRGIDFSIWPVRLGQGGWVSNTRIFVSEPWAVIRRVVEDECPKKTREAALAFLEQSYDYFKAASFASVTAARPLLLYYSFMNLAKVLILARNARTNLDVARHGLSEQIKIGQKELTGAFLDAYPSNNNHINIFNELLTIVKGSGLTAPTKFDIPIVLRQILTGHRLFVAATKGTGETFIAIEKIEMLDNGTDQIWLRIGIVRGDLARLGISQAAFCARAQLVAATWRPVAPAMGANSDMLWFEQVTPTNYSPSWLSDAVQPMINTVKPLLWQVVSSMPPYRHYYLYLPPPSELPFVLPQILSSYAAMYYFGSITRYRPHHFDKILGGPYGPFVESFLHDQPSQMLFMMASEFAKRDVTRAAIV